jgi:hypothetical protein
MKLKNLKIVIFVTCLPLLGTAQILGIKDSLLHSANFSFEELTNSDNTAKEFAFTYQIDVRNLLEIIIDNKGKIVRMQYILREDSNWKSKVRLTNFIVPLNRVIYFTGKDLDDKFQYNLLQGVFIVLDKHGRIIYVAEFMDGIKKKELYRKRSFRKKVNVKFGYQLAKSKKYRDI